MEIFSSNRLMVSSTQAKDKAFFFELLSDPEITSLIPQQPFSDKKKEKLFLDSFRSNGNPLLHQQHIWGVFEKGSEDLIGIAALLTNDTDNRTIGYRFRKQYWGKGYGTELVKSLLDFCFHTLHLEVICADVSITNLDSIKILEKFFTFQKEFFNATDHCTDRRYIAKKKDWIHA